MTKIIDLLTPYLRPQSEAELESSLSSLSAALAHHFSADCVGILTSRSGQRSARLNGWFPLAERRHIRDQITALHADGAIAEAFESGKLHHVGQWMVQPITHNAATLGLLLINKSEPTATDNAEAAFVAGQLAAQLQVCQLHAMVQRGQSQGEDKRAKDAKEVAFYAQYDPLTRLHNRKSFEQFVDQQITENCAARHWLLWIDLLEFSRINQGFGHQCGDDVLIEVAGRLQRVLGTGNGLARVEGDAFAVYIDGEQARTESAVIRIAEQLVSGVSHPMQWGDVNLPLKCAVGISSYTKHGDHAKALLAQASHSCKATANKAVNSIQMCGEVIVTSASRQMLIEAQLNESMHKGEFELFYQPKIEIKTGALVGAEALLRWNQGNAGMVQPDVFIEVAERGGQIAQLGRWVLREACRRLRYWRDEGVKDFTVSVNLSLKQLHRGDLVSDVASALREYSLPPHALELELTETIALSDQETVIRRFNELKNLGVKLAIDDFGKGYSGLSTLKSIPAEVIKIDRSFIADLTHSDVDQAIVESVIHMAHRIGKKVVAEGVETLAQMQFLQRAGCDHAQGFFVRPPMSFTEFESFITMWTAEQSVP